MSKKSKKKEQPPQEIVSEEAAVEEQAAETEPGIDELKGQLQRLGADYQNYQKRSLRQIEQTREFAQEHLVRALLPVLDNFEHTLAKGGETQDVASVIQGVQIVFDHMVKVLEGEGMVRIEVEVGKVFDPNLHEALLQEESDEQPAQSIMRELMAGYQMNGRTLRPAKVSVAKKPVEKVEIQEMEEEEQEEQQQQHEEQGD